MKYLDEYRDGAAARKLADTEALLERLATALFPGGPGDRSSVTWPDRPACGGDREGEPGPGGLPMTEQSRTEAKLRAAEARYRTLVEQIPAVTFMAVLGEERTRFT